MIDKIINKYSKIAHPKKKVPLFTGKESYAEEFSEAYALKSGKIKKSYFIKGELSEGHKAEKTSKIAQDIFSGKMSPKQYAIMASKEKKWI